MTMTAYTREYESAHDTRPVPSQEQTQCAGVKEGSTYFAFLKVNAERLTLLL